MATPSNWCGRWPVVDQPTDRLAGRRLYLCTPDRPDLADFIDACIAGGVDVVQLREKNLDAGASRFVVVRYLTEPADPEARARALRRSIDARATPAAPR